MTYKLSILTYEISIMAYELSIMTYELSIMTYELSVMPYEDGTRGIPLDPMGAHGIPGGSPWDARVGLWGPMGPWTQASGDPLARGPIGQGPWPQGTWGPWSPVLLPRLVVRHLHKTTYHVLFICVFSF